jgi:hypothetical protein
MIAAVASAVLLALGAFVSFKALWDRDADNSALARRVEENKKRVEDAKLAVREWDELEKWQAEDIPWLDKLSNASVKLPPPDEMMVTKLQITSDSRGPTATIDGVAKSVATIEVAESSLRDERQRVDSKGSAPDTTVPGFTRKFTSQIRPYDPVAEEAAAKKAAAAKRQGPISLRGNGK